MHFGDNLIGSGSVVSVGANVCERSAVFVASDLDCFCREANRAWIKPVFAAEAVELSSSGVEQLTHNQCLPFGSCQNMNLVGTNSRMAVHEKEKEGFCNDLWRTPADEEEHVTIACGPGHEASLPATCRASKEQLGLQRSVFVEVVTNWGKKVKTYQSKSFALVVFH